MEQVNDRSDEQVRSALDHELRLIGEAIGMVASGASSRVVVAGVQFGDVLLDEARRLAAEAGVRIVPMWGPDEAGADIAVERIE